MDAWRFSRKCWPKWTEAGIEPVSTADTGRTRPFPSRCRDGTNEGDCRSQLSGGGRERCCRSRPTVPAIVVGSGVGDAPNGGSMLKLIDPLATRHLQPSAEMALPCCPSSALLSVIFATSTS
jgi:hypothetical protein